MGEEADQKASRPEAKRDGLHHAEDDYAELYHGGSTVVFFHRGSLLRGAQEVQDFQCPAGVVLTICCSPHLYGGSS